MTYATDGDAQVWVKCGAMEQFVGSSRVHAGMLAAHAGAQRRAHTVCVVQNTDIPAKQTELVGSSVFRWCPK